ncbi:MAG: YHS domain-containing (seleno)protein [Albidovulum sp.]|uniref:YHS domain-containing (seleno)protein n=1 Tax=Albidovulum sp. TaxID=1872424 RepID=UPI003C870E17
MKTTLLIAALTAALPVFAAPAFAADELNVAPGLSYAGAPVGLHGADPVAVVNGDVITGEGEFSSVLNGAAYYFATAENKAEFDANPTAFEPQNGGFCTYGVSVGKKFDGDPRHAVVHEGKLYVFLNAKTRELFLEDVAGALTNATQNWAKIEHVAATDL